MRAQEELRALVQLGRQRSSTRLRAGGRKGAPLFGFGRGKEEGSLGQEMARDRVEARGGGFGLGRVGWMDWIGDPEEGGDQVELVAADGMDGTARTRV